MLNGYVYDNKDANIESWDLNIESFTFHCSYTPQDDWIEVFCSEISSAPKGAEAKYMNHASIAKFLASEILKEAT